MKSFWLALQFLTIIPVRIVHVSKEHFAQALVYFPVVGLIIGLCLAGLSYALSILRFASLSTDIILVISLIIITGGIHLDGLSDTCDALASRADKVRMLEIMRDSHAGVMGIISIISIILLKISFLSSLSSSVKMAALILMGLISRWALVGSMFMFPYAREEGKAKIFMQGINSRIFLLATVITLAIVFVVGQFKGWLIFLLATISTYAFGAYLKRKIGGISGDTLGALNECIETMVLLGVCLSERIAL